MCFLRKRCFSTAVWLSPCIGIFLPLCVAAAEAVPTGKWQVAPPAGEGSMALSLKAEKPIAGWMKTFTPVLTIQCGKGKAALFVETGVGLEVTMIDQQIVRVHIDDNKPAPQRWQEVTNSTVSATSRDATALIKQFIQSQKFIFEFTPFNVSPVQAEFSVAGLSAYMPQLSEACFKK